MHFISPSFSTSLKLTAMVALLAVGLGAQAPSHMTPKSGENATNAYAAVNVPDTMTHIEEKSLIWVGQRVLDDSLATRDNEQTSPFRDLAEEERQAVRIYRFVLKPKEKLSVALKAADDSLISMEFVRIVRTDPMMRQIRKANFPAEQRRRKAIEIENPATEPRDCYLRLLGKRNFPYTMDLTRTPLS